MKKLVLALAMIGAVGGANAATIPLGTLQNNGGSLFAVAGQYAGTDTPQDFSFSYAGGTAIFKFISAFTAPNNPIGGASYSLSGGTLVSPVAFSLDNDISTAISDVANFVLGSGNYILSVSAGKGLGTTVTDISAVPLPAAALLFGSSLLGAGALRRKQKAGKEVVAV